MYVCMYVCICVRVEIMILLPEPQAGKSHLMWVGKLQSQSDKEINCLKKYTVDNSISQIDNSFRQHYISHAKKYIGKLIVCVLLRQTLEFLLVLRIR